MRFRSSRSIATPSRPSSGRDNRLLPQLRDPAQTIYMGASTSFYATTIWTHARGLSTRRSPRSVAISTVPRLADCSYGTRLSSSERLKVCEKRREEHCWGRFRTPRFSQVTFRQSPLRSSIPRRARHSSVIESRTIAFQGLRRDMPNTFRRQIIQDRTIIGAWRILSIIRTLSLVARIKLCHSVIRFSNAMFGTKEAASHQGLLQTLTIHKEDRTFQCRALSRLRPGTSTNSNSATTEPFTMCFQSIRGGIRFRSWESRIWRAASTRLTMVFQP